ncbi:VOC family protein [Vibrio sp. JPW-9-11-11]|uniref:VOC family protein n=1 Tax=Vibrio sp. JPW-9-11-11 TaxID=1416532 RepID=UPI001594B9A8|nr:VOC family protein [Vibrio sp. JPW-9-11-11]NVD07989.1 VOC family protein [Vibrio sp. JPW-9-11-11]
MIQLEHINLVVDNIPKTLAFYQTAFPHWFVRDEGQGEWYGKARNWLHFGDDYQYIALSDHGEGNNRDLAGHQIGLAHFAFMTNNLDALVERLTQAGYPIAKPGAVEPFRKNIYYVDPAGFEVEFVEYLSDDPKQRNRSS